MQMLRRQSLVSTRSTRTFSIHSSGSGKDQDSPTSEKRKGPFPVIKGKDSTNSISMANDNNEMSETDNGITFKVPDSDVFLKQKDDNENIPFLCNQKVSFF